MSIYVMTLVWQHAPYKGNTLLTFLCLADFSNDAGVLWPSVETIARKTRQSERNARYCLREIEKDGFVSTEPRRDDSSMYRINIHKLDTGAKTAPPAKQSKKGGKTTPETCSILPPNHQEPSSEQPSVLGLAEHIYENWKRKDARKPSIVKTSQAIEKIAKRDFVKEAAKSENIHVLVVAARWLWIQVKKQNAIYHAESRPVDKIPMLATWMNQERYDDDVINSLWKQFSSGDRSVAQANGLNELRARRAARA